MNEDVSPIGKGEFPAMLLEGIPRCGEVSHVSSLPGWIPGVQR